LKLKLNIGTKIALGFGLMIILLGILSANSLISLSNIKDNLNTIDASNERMSLEYQALNSFTNGVANIRGYLAYGDEKYSSQIDPLLTKTIDLEKKLYSIARTEKKDSIQQLINNTTSYKDGIVKELVPVVKQQFEAKKAGNVELANQLDTQAVIIASKYAPTLEQLTNTLSSLSTENDNLLNNDISTAKNIANSSVTYAMILIAVSLILGLLITVFITLSLKRPIEKLVRYAKKYSEGDLTQVIEIQTGDEISQLADALNTMRVSFVDMITGINKTAHEVTAYSEELNASSEQNAQAVHQITDNITQVAAGVTKQSESISDTSSVIEQMTASFEEVAATASSMSLLTEQTNEANRAGGESINRLVVQVSQIGEGSTQIKEAIDHLLDSSVKIGNISNLISDIANQTNLLALNAAIEAARAGDAGRGFAVVADEVRKLAEQSQSAAKEINELIQDNQTNISNAVSTVNLNQDVVAKGVSVAQLAGKAIDDISNLVSQLIQQIESITAATQEVAGGSTQAVQMIEGIDSVSSLISSQAQEVSALTEEQNASIEQIVGASQSLAQMAVHLETLIHKFKVI
jgi:methyl-accepting chemotaxis protein